MASTFTITVSSGETLSGWYWPAENAFANLDVITGMDEYAFRYEKFAMWMNAQGVSVHVLDAFGQGLNAESVEKQEIWPADGFRKNVEAIHRMNLNSKKNGLPTFQMGHSMGSFFTQSVMERFPGSVDGYIICGSNGGQRGLMKVAYGLARLVVTDRKREQPVPFLQNLGLGGYAKAIKNRRTDFDWLSVNEDNVEAYIADPWCGHENSGGFWLEFLKGMTTIWDKGELAKISEREHVLLISGEEDPVGQNGKGIRWLADTYRKLGLTDVEMHLYPHMRHEILNEKDAEVVRKDILSFLQAHAE